MTADNRSVQTDALATLGTIIDENAGRDAIHLAVLPAVAGEVLAPGERVTLLQTHRDRTVAMASGEGQGVVDPFLKVHVQPGERFWFIVNPRTITSLRHVWSHPFFDKAEADDDAANKRWKEIAAEMGARPEEVATNAETWVRYGEYWSEGERGEGHPGLPSDFWDVFEKVSGVTVPGIKRRDFFS